VYRKSPQSLFCRISAGFTITTALSDEYKANGKKLPTDVMTEVMEHIKKIEAQMGQTFGSTSKPLLVAVRSGAPVSMPGMLDTVLNIGLNDEVVAALAAATSTRFAYDSYRRFLAIFGEVVLGIEQGAFESELDLIREELAVDEDSALTGEHLQKVVARFKEIYKTHGVTLPTDPKAQVC
jgi:pyruvate,orthophosphate dikinase